MTDEQLVLLSRNGDKQAQNQLLNKYHAFAEAIAARFFLCGGETEDLVQEGLVGLYSAIGSYEPSRGASFFTHAGNCIRNSIIDAVKKSTAAKRAALNNFVPLVEIGGEFSPDDPEDEIIKRENKRAFQQKISRELSAMEYKIVIMYLDGMSVSEIAQTLSKPSKSISNALARAKNKLFKLYSKED